MSLWNSSFVRYLMVVFCAAGVLGWQDPQADARKFAEIKARFERGEPLSREEREWAQEYRRRQMSKGGTPDQAQKKLMEDFRRKNPPRPSTGLVPLTDLGRGLYQGQEGGLYPGGVNVPPSQHLKAGLALAKQIAPLDAQGKPSPDGKIVLLSIGMSNTTQEFQVFMKLAASEPGLNPRLAIVDGAQGGQTARVTADPQAKFWDVVAERLRGAGVAERQVQVAWVKQANARPTEPFPAEAKRLSADLIKTLQNLHDKFPNLKIAYLSSRIYGGYALTPLNPEPHAYEGAFAVKWVIADQIAGKPELNFDPAKGAVRAPWTAWGPYLWADGVKGRKMDGLVWLAEDLAETDRTHPSESGRRKVAEQLLQFLKTDPTAKPWFLAR
jgi:hypothetical protein